MSCPRLATKDNADNFGSFIKVRIMIETLLAILILLKEHTVE